MKNVMLKQRAYSAQNLINALNEMALLTGRGLDEISLDNVDMATLWEVKLTDGSTVYDVSLEYVGPDQNVPF